VQILQSTLDEVEATMGQVSTPMPQPREREFFIDNLLVRINFIIVMIRWTGLAPWEFAKPAKP